MSLLDHSVSATRDVMSLLDHRVGAAYDVVSLLDHRAGAAAKPRRLLLEDQQAAVRHDRRDTMGRQELLPRE